MTQWYKQLETRGTYHMMKTWWKDIPTKCQPNGFACRERHKDSYPPAQFVFGCPPGCHQSSDTDPCLDHRFCPICPVWSSWFICQQIEFLIKWVISFHNQLHFSPLTFVFRRLRQSGGTQCEVAHISLIGPSSSLTWATGASAIHFATADLTFQVHQ